MWILKGVECQIKDLGFYHPAFIPVLPSTVALALGSLNYEAKNVFVVVSKIFYFIIYHPFPKLLLSALGSHQK